MGSPYEDGCILALAGGPVQTGHPVNRGTVLRTMARLATLVLLIVLAAAPAAEAAAPKLKVMTRNIFLGGNIALPIGAPTRAEFEQRATQLWQQVETTDFPVRAKLLAREVRRTKPDLIGLQEVAHWRRDRTTTVYDFLALLRAELRRAGLRYRVGSVQEEADIEAPISLGYSVRLTMRDVILVRARKGLRVRRRLGGNFKAEFPVDTPVGRLISRRGWTAIDATLQGERFRFVNTHLESFADDLRLQQARALLAGPLRKRGRVILAGDLNSDPEGATGANPAAYRALTRAGLKDTWLSVRPRSKGWSCCSKQEVAMDPPPIPFDHRVDHVLAKGRVRVLGGRVIGDDPANRAASGLWPSDHGGAVMTLRLR